VRLQVLRLAPGADPSPLAFRGAYLTVNDIDAAGRRLLVTESLANEVILIGEMATGTFTRLEAGAANRQNALWSPDSRWVIFNSDLHGGGPRLYRVPVDGSSPPERLLENETRQDSGSVSRDASLLAYTTWSEETGLDVYLLPITPEGAPAGEPRPVATAPGFEDRPAVSPDGHLVAYTLREVGADAVHVVNLETNDRIRLSPVRSDGATWSPDGGHLFYVSDGGIYRIELLDAATLTFGEAIPVAEGDYHPWLVVEPDGRSILTNSVGTGTRSSEIRIDLNWGQVLREQR
jgi:Tol biopolymer transport system component